jgi:exopolysaccharide biosynthesis polyprenyl glycosylphosphotransferase
VVIFFRREFFSSRFIILAAWLLGFIYVTVFHLLIRFMQRALYKKGVGIHKVILVGGNIVAEVIAREFNRFPDLGYQVVKHYQTLNQANWSLLQEQLKSREIDEVINANTSLSRQDLNRLVDLTVEYNVIFKYAADILGTLGTNFDMHMFAGVPIVEVKKTKLDGWGRVYKRIQDLIFSLLLLILLLPLFLLLAIIIKLDSKGSVFVGLERVGSRGKKFILYKFRSMIRGAHALKKELISFNERADGPLFKIKEDPRLTHVGRYLRQFSLDELPNLWNVLKGEMSLIGPRPHEPEEIEKYQKHHKRLLDIKPGITGLSQISGRSDLSFEEEVRLDTFYIENWSPLFDLWILYKTPLVVLSRQSAC